MTVFKPNPRFREEMAKDPHYRPGLREHGEHVKTAVQTVAPHTHGDYAESIEVVEDNGEVFVNSTDPFAHLIEFGSVNNPPYAPLRRGVRAAGLSLKEDPK